MLKYLLVLLVLFFFASKSVLATNLIVNGDFESDTSSWSTYGSSIQLSGDHSYNGNNSGKVETSTTNSGTKYVYQAISVKENQNYALTGFGIKQGEPGSKVFIRVAFYLSSDGSGSQIDTFTTNSIENNSDDFQLLEIASMQAPSGAKSARVRLSVDMPSGASEKGVAYFDDAVFEEMTETPSPTEIPTETPVPTKESSSAVYQINDAKDEGGNALSSVKIYIDGVYVHHYAPETIEFCEGCDCDGYVTCGYGEHTIRLEKSGYENWSRTKTFNAGDSYSDDPVLLAISSDPQSTPTLKLTESPENTSTPKPEVKSKTDEIAPSKVNSLLSKTQEVGDYVLGMRNELDTND
ncbi:MAG: carbohydrate binding domain-containing protein, partial [Candidatus Woesebacteria bacterium]